MQQYVRKARTRFALVNGKRREAQPGLSGECPGCGNPVHARCGEKYIWHWSHRSKHVCDPWWENKTEWHRAWQNQFADEWQEVICLADDGERHIADVKTDRGWVIEFQHSPLDAEERRSREVFYQKLVWVVDAARRKNDTKRFFEALDNGTRIAPTFLVWQVHSEDCVLLREWAGRTTPVFFDFGHERPLGWLIAGKADGLSYVGPISHANFIAMHRRETPTVRDFDELVKQYRELVAAYELHLQRLALSQSSPPLKGFQRHLARRNRARGRL